MDVNFIITCHDTEEQVHLLVNLLKSYKIIKPHIVVAYSGEKDNFPCHVRIANTEPHSRELGLIKEGMNVFRRSNNKIKKLVKLSAYVWPTDENKLIDIFKRLEEARCPYAGNYWHYNMTGSLAADFFVADLTYGDFIAPLMQITNDTEVTLYRQIVKDMKKKVLIISERDPVFWNNYYECKALGVTMYPDPTVNLQTMKDWEIE